MNPFIAQLRAALWWLVPLAALLVLIGWEIGWGSEVRKRQPPDEPIAPKPVAASLLPDYGIEGGLAARTETVNRTLFNPTRRPAPVAVAEAAKPRMQRGLYALTGTTLAGDRSLAFLKEIKGGKARTVKQGDNIGGVLVAEVKPDRVRLALGDESEELMLKVATNPKPTPVPAAPAAVPGGGAAAPGAAPEAPVRPQQPAPGAAPRAQDAGQTLAERRRAARAAEAAAAAAAAAGTATPPASGAADSPPAAQTPAGTTQADPAWQAMEERYRRRSPAAQRR
jgi:hypothetical protein